MVAGIVSIDRYDVTVTGFANAGTTPMADRQDALLAASHLAIAGGKSSPRSRSPRRHCRSVNVTPNSPNVVPGVCG